MNIFTESVRLQPSADGLNLHLKNTHFNPEDILPENLDFSVETISTLPLLVFKFKNASKSFAYPLNYFELKNGEMGWVAQEKFYVKVEVADTVIADQISSTKFTLHRTESQQIREHIDLQRQYTPDAIDLLEDFAQTSLSGILN